MRLPRVHVCNGRRGSPGISPALHEAIALAIGRMRRSVSAPVVWVTRSPVCLGPRLVFSVVGIATKALTLPTPPPLALAFGS